MGTYTETCEKLYLENIILKDAILDAIDDIKIVGEYQIAYDLKEALDKCCKTKGKQ